MQNHERSKSQTYLKEVAPLGGELTPAQSREYRKLLIEEGVVSVSAEELLLELKETQEEMPIPTECICNFGLAD